MLEPEPAATVSLRRGTSLRIPSTAPAEGKGSVGKDKDGRVGFPCPPLPPSPREIESKSKLRDGFSAFLERNGSIITGYSDARTNVESISGNLLVDVTLIIARCTNACPCTDASRTRDNAACFHIAFQSIFRSGPGVGVIPPVSLAFSTFRNATFFQLHDDEQKCATHHAENTLK